MTGEEAYNLVVEAMGPPKYVSPWPKWSDLIEDARNGYERLAVMLTERQAEAWDEGARWGAVEFQTQAAKINDESQVELAPGDNPYREVSK